MKKKILFIVLAIILVAILFVLTACGNSSSTEEQAETEEKSNYLADIVEIGDYVDIGIEYEATEIDSSYLKNTYSNNEITGWRVLSVSGEGETATIKLISAGSPLTLTYYNGDCSYAGRGVHADDVYLKALQSLEDLFVSELKVEVNDLVRAKEYNESYYYTGNDFLFDNLQTLFTSSKYVDTSAGIHNITEDELIDCYNNITGLNISSIDELTDEYSITTTGMLSKNQNINKKTYDLLGNGTSYWISNSYYTPTVAESSVNIISSNNNWKNGSVRVVLTLNTGIEIAEDNTGDGSSSDMAYTLK